ncbi:MAG: serine protease, partial [Bdellovibrionia bacterium]
ECSRTFLAFDYLMNSPYEMPSRVAQENLFRCRRIVAREKTEFLDYAFLELDRPVTGRPYFQLDVKKEVEVGDRVFVIGSPIGLPAKIGDGYVREGEDESFDTNLDTYEGNSGSPVFSLQNGLIVGILVNGEDDFVNHGSCKISKRCRDNECKGEQVARITSILADFYNKTRP